MQFAPVCRLRDGVLAAAELQLRGADRTRYQSATDLRRAARLMDQKVPLDEHKLQLAGTATAVSVAERLPLLVSVDLDVTHSYGDADLQALGRLIVCVSPGDVVRRPHRTLATVAAARRHGRLICIDGMGASETAMAMLPLIEPDIVVTPPELLTRSADPDMAQLAHALMAHIERSHAVVVAEGVDSEELRDTAVTVGATYGVGELYPAVTQPEALLGRKMIAFPEAPVWNTPGAELDTPYAIASQGIAPRRGTKHLLVEMSKSLEAQAAAVGQSMIVIGTFQHRRHFTSATSERWRELADATGFAGVYGVGLSNMVDGNIQHAPLDPADDLVNEWTVAVLGPHFAALLAARDLHDNGPDLQRTFDFVQSFDRVTVTQAINSILARFTG